MKIKPMKDSSYNVESEHKKGIFYKVYPSQPFCDCPQFMYRELKLQGECKHIKAVRDYINKKKIKVKEKIGKIGNGNTAAIISYVRDKKEVDSVGLIEKFGEDKVNELLKKADLIEFKGKIRLLE